MLGSLYGLFASCTSFFISSIFSLLFSKITRMAGSIVDAFIFAIVPIPSKAARLLIAVVTFSSNNVYASFAALCFLHAQLSPFACILLIRLNWSCDISKKLTIDVSSSVWICPNAFILSCIPLQISSFCFAFWLISSGLCNSARCCDM